MVSRAQALIRRPRCLLPLSHAIRSVRISKQQLNVFHLTTMPFDLVISYLSLIDIRDMQAAISEMARVLNPDGAVLIANLNSFNTACS
ncbi:MAG: class I SAM-dependent methyltransferase, partial [Candidatus Acidiferrum sp.]